ncbi:response regulator [Mesorhizobium sp. 10J20-29]
MADEMGVALSERLRGLRVLVVEDEPLIAMLLEDMLIELGAIASEYASNVADGTSIVERGGIDIAILDLNLDGTPVFPIAKLLRSRGLPFTFASGYGVAGLPSEFEGYPCVAKPYQMEEIAAALIQALSSPTPTSESVKR